jgi:hypothetical protein
MKSYERANIAHSMRNASLPICPYTVSDDPEFCERIVMEDIEYMARFPDKYFRSMCFIYHTEQQILDAVVAKFNQVYPL